MDQAKKRVPRWLKIVVLSLLGLLTLIILIVAFSEDQNKKSRPASVVENAVEKQPFADLIAAIKADDTYHVKAVKVYGGMLYVAATDLGKGSEGGAAWHFLETYNLNRDRAISKCLVYKWHKKDKEDSVFVKWESVGENIPNWRKEEIEKNWMGKNLSKYDGSCEPVTKYLLANLNDAESYDHVETKCFYEVQNDNFRIFCTFRAKNAFGAIMLNHVVAIVSEEGEVISVHGLN